MNYTIRPIEKKDDLAVEKVIRSCLIEFGANHEGTAWADPYLNRFSEIYNSPGNQYWDITQMIFASYKKCTASPRCEAPAPPMN